MNNWVDIIHAINEPSSDLSKTKNVADAAVELVHCECRFLSVIARVILKCNCPCNFCCSLARVCDFWSLPSSPIQKAHEIRRDSCLSDWVSFILLDDFILG